MNNTARRGTLPSDPLDAGPFVIVHHHRKAKKLKKLRQLRRKKMQIRKEHERMTAQSQKKEALEHINRSMLLEEDMWNSVKALIVSEDSPEATPDQEEALEKKVKNLCWQVLYVIPTVPRTAIFRNEFCKFEYGK